MAADAVAEVELTQIDRTAGIAAQQAFCVQSPCRS